MATPLDLVRTATLGFVAGQRSVMPLALLSAHLQPSRAGLADRGWAVDVLASPWGAVSLGVAAVGEVVADKLPIIPSRLDPLPLAGRVVLGGTAGALQSLAEGRASDIGALAASLGALVGSVVGYQLRTGLQRRMLWCPGASWSRSTGTLARRWMASVPAGRQHISLSVVTPDLSLLPSAVTLVSSQFQLDVLQHVVSPVLHVHPVPARP